MNWIAEIPPPSSSNSIEKYRLNPKSTEVSSTTLAVHIWFDEANMQNATKARGVSMRCIRRNKYKISEIAMKTQRRHM